MTSPRRSSGCAAGGFRSSWRTASRTACELAVALIIVACAASPGGGGASRDIPFEVLAQGQMGDTDALAGGPRLVVAADPAGRASLERLIRQPLAARGDLVVIGAFQGTQRTAGYAIGVERVLAESDRALAVVARLARPAPDAITLQVLTSPFAVVGVRTIDLPPGRVQFALRDASGARLATAELVR